MFVYDLTHPVSESMPVYPGSEKPRFETVAVLETEQYREKKITIYSHTGTHIDAPAHITAGGKTLDAFPAGTFVGPALVIDVSDCNGIIEAETLQPYGQTLETVDFVLLHTGWSRFWGDTRYFSGYPVLSVPAAEWLAGFRLKGVGMDTVSVDPPDFSGFQIHKAFLSRDILLIENLTNLGPIAGRTVQFTCLSLKLAEAEGAPARAIAVLSK